MEASAPGTIAVDNSTIHSDILYLENYMILTKVTVHFR